MAENPVNDLESLKLKLEIEKLEIEKQRLQIELERYKREKINFNIIIPLLIAILTFGVNFWLQDRQSRNDFQLKAAEIIMSSTTTTGTYNRAMALTTLFPGKLPENFAQSFDTKKYGGPSNDLKVELLNLISEYPERRNEIVEVFKLLWSDADWADVLKEE